MITTERRPWPRFAAIMVPSLLAVLSAFFLLIHSELSGWKATARLGAPVFLEAHGLRVSHVIVISATCIGFAVLFVLRFRRVLTRKECPEGPRLMAAQWLFLLLAAATWTAGVRSYQRWYVRLADAHNLSTIGAAYLSFTAESDGRFPRDLVELAESEIGYSRVFVNPANIESGIPRTGPELVAKCDYVYVGGEVLESAQSSSARCRLICYSKTPFAGGWRNLLYDDGHVEYRRGTMAVNVAKPPTAHDGSQ